VLSEGDPNTRERLEQAVMFKATEPSDQHNIELCQEDDKIILYGRDVDVANLVRRVQLGSRPRGASKKSIGELFLYAEIFVRSRNLIQLASGTENEEFRPNIRIRIGQIEGEGVEQIQLAEIHTRLVIFFCWPRRSLRIVHLRGEALPQQLELTEGQRLYFKIRNMDKDAEKSMRVFLFDVSATGEINSLAHA